MKKSVALLVCTAAFCLNASASNLVQFAESSNGSTLYIDMGTFKIDTKHIASAEFQFVNKDGSKDETLKMAIDTNQCKAEKGVILESTYTGTTFTHSNTYNWSKTGNMPPDAEAMVLCSLSK